MDNRVEIIMMEMEETPVCDAGATEKCLFCAVSLPPSFTIANGKITRLKRETADHDDCLSNPGSLLSTEDSVLDKHLEVVFILRKILDIPERKLHQFLKQFGGQLHPEFWVGVCALCGEAVQQFYTALKEISELKKRLTRISKQLKGRIYDTREVGGAENGLTCIWEEIRGEVLKDFQEVPSREVDVLKIDPEETTQQKVVDSEGCGNINSRKILPSCYLSKGLSENCSFSRFSSYSEPEEEVDNDEEPISDFESDDHDSNWSNHSKNSETVKQEPAKMQLMPSHMKSHHRQEDELKKKPSDCASQLHKEPLATSVVPKQKSAHQIEDSLRRSLENPEPNLITLSLNCELPGKEDAACDESMSDFKLDNDDDSNLSRTHSEDSEVKEYKPSPRKRVLKRTNSLSAPQAIRNRGHPPNPTVSSVQLKSSRKKKTRRVSDKAYQSLYTSFRRGKYEMLKCSLCSAVRDKRDRMIVHLKYHEKGEGSLCSQCGWLVPPGDMNRHIFRNHSCSVQKDKAGQPKNEKNRYSYSFKCTKCPARSSEKGFLDRHLPLHDPSNEEPCTTCELCGCLVKSTMLKRHLAGSVCAIIIQQKRGDRDIAYSCDFCQMLYTRKKFLTRHFRIYHADQEFAVCVQPNCQEKFESKQLLKFHMDMAHPDVQNLEENPESEEGDSKCPHCELIFASEMKKDYHIAEKHKSILLTCTTCNITMKDYMCYRKHMEQTSIHATSPSVFCELCGTSVWSDNLLRAHKRQEHFAELGLEPIKCQECGLSLSSNAALKKHIKAVHAKEKNYSCEYCGQSFSTQGIFANHLSAFHKGPLATVGATDGKHFRLEKKGNDGVKTWLCDFCPGTVTFANLTAIRYHLLKAHYSELKFICEGCNQRFCASLGLHKHRKRCGELKKKNKCGNEEELNRKTYHCRFCSKQFFSPTSLAKHERSLHKDRHSHICQKCGKAFKTFGMLANHQKKCVLVPPSETVTDVTE